MAKIQFLGATGCVTGSRFLVSAETGQVLIDCGLFQGPKELRLRNWAPFPADLRRLHSIVLTHAHLDHTGYFPRLVKDGFQGQVYASPATVDLCGILWPDSGHLQEEDARYANKKGFSKHDPALPLYTEVDGIEATRYLEKIPYRQETRIGAQFSFSLIPAGHIFGSNFVQMQVGVNGEKRHLLFSGDLGRYDQPITPDPTPVEETDYLVVESTYGNRLHLGADPKLELAAIINRTAGRGGMILIPSFAVGRTQELLYLLRELEDAQRIPRLPVYVDSPMAIDATRILLRYPEEHDLEMQTLENSGIDPLNSRQVNLVRTRELSQAINGIRYPMIVIASSGMATGGRILHHLAQRLPDPRNTILFVGYQAEGTRGRTLLDKASEVKIHGQMVQVRAEIRSLEQFSAHADYSEILRWLGDFKRPPRRTYILHGENEQRKALSAHIREKLGWETLLPEYLETFELD
jgi:metallo-beta-lactamase family protein